MKNSDRYLAAFNSIEKILKTITGFDHHMSFAKLLGYAGKSNAVIKKYQEDLREFAVLRNAIVHESIDPNYAIAEPHTSVVEKIEFIEGQLKKPEEVIPRFRRKVITFETEDSVGEALKAIKTYAYSQFPIYKQGIFEGLLTDKGIIRWLARNIDKKDCSLGTELGEVLGYEKSKENFKFIRRSSSVYDIRSFFKGQKGAPSLEALLITLNGRLHEPLLGIITPYDLADLP